jgi:hypothetical protein
LGGPADRAKQVNYKGNKVIIFRTCKPHRCNDDFLYVMYNPINKEVRGEVFIDKRKHPFLGTTHEIECFLSNELEEKKYHK